MQHKVSKQYLCTSYMSHVLLPHANTYRACVQKSGGSNTLTDTYGRTGCIKPLNQHFATTLQKILYLTLTVVLMMIGLNPGPRARTVKPGPRHLRTRPDPGQNRLGPHKGIPCVPRA